VSDTRRKPPSDTVNLTGSVTIYQEDDEGNREYITEKNENHFTDAMLKGLTSYLCCSTVTATTCWAYDAFIVLGLDTVTPTYHNMTGLYMPIGSGVGTAPNFTSGDGIFEKNGAFYVDFISTWNKETVSGRVGELGLYLRPFVNINAMGTGTQSTPQAMCSRLAAADDTFTPFYIDSSKSLTVVWEVSIDYV